MLVVQGGPGTGKTVVALHRAAYLLYTHRFPLEDQGVLVIGPNRLFLGYIEQVLPSLGEAGVELAVLADLVDSVGVRGGDRPASRPGQGRRAHGQGAGQGRARPQARPPPRPRVRLRPPDPAGRAPSGPPRIVRRRPPPLPPPQRRPPLRRAAAVRGAGRGQPRRRSSVDEVRGRLRRTPEVREALERMWPVLTPAELLHDLYGSRALLRSAGGRILSDEEVDALHRPRSATAADVTWTADDVPLLDEARALLGATPRAKRRGEGDEVRTYGHIVVDEAQDLSPMQLRMLSRRSLNGSMTIVGDIAQSTGAWAHADWDEMLRLLPDRRPSRRAELTVGYRIPAPNMALAARVLAEAAPELSRPARCARTGARRVFVGSARRTSCGDAVAEAVTAEPKRSGVGNVAVIAPARWSAGVAGRSSRPASTHGVAAAQGLDHQVTVVPVGMVKGLELDATVVVEPAAIVDEEAQGMRALYVALTRATKLLAIVHARRAPGRARGRRRRTAWRWERAGLADASAPVVVAGISKRFGAHPVLRGRRPRRRPRRDRRPPRPERLRQDDAAAPRSPGSSGPTPARSAPAGGCCRRRGLGAARAARVGMVFQDWALFPHMTVAATSRYGLPRRSGVGPGGRGARAWSA